MNLNLLLALGDRAGTPSVDQRATLCPLHRLPYQIFVDFRFGLPGLLQGWALARMDGVEKDRHSEVTAELRGLSREEVRIELAHDSFVISGEQRQENEGTKGSRKVTKRSYGSFARTLNQFHASRPRTLR